MITVSEWIEKAQSRIRAHEEEIETASREKLIETVADLESQIDFLAKGILDRQSQLNVPMINSKYPFGMSAVEAALEAIDNLLIDKGKSCE